ncbi:MAG: conjugative transposon protein TraM [Paludibacteraceae bacterium]|nr:conjugative transposon protein TraM [Paludibacteraceae bacterium]
MGRKQKSLHIYSVFALILVIVTYYVLGGGTQSDINAMGKSYDINMDIPDSKEEDLAADRFAAEKREEIRNQEQNHRDMMQKHSFSILQHDTIPESDGARKTSQSPNYKTCMSSSISMDEKKRKTENKYERKREIMKKKRAQLEKELGINLSDYGYTKYETPNEDDVMVKDQKVEMASSDNVTSNSRSGVGGFYGLESNTDNFEGDVKAVVHGDQKNLKSGAIIKLRLIETLEIDGVNVPKNTFVYGKLTFGNGRGIIKIQNINYRNKILLFKGTVYDSDGFEGIYVPDNIVSDTKSKAASAALGGVDIKTGSKSKVINSTISSIGDVIKNAVQGSIKESKISISSNYLVTIKRIK